jgi:hypothetical protein
MRHRIREQSYVDPELNRQVRAYEAARGWNHSAFTTVAYERFLGGERGGADLILSRLDTLTQRLERLQNTLDLFAMAFARYAEAWCRFLPISLPAPDSMQRGDRFYAQLMRAVADKFRAGRRLSGEVFPATGELVPPRPGSGGGGKGPAR